MKKALLCFILVAAMFTPLVDLYAACGNVTPPQPPVTPPVGVPEPGVLMLLAMGVAGLIAAKRKRQR
ncbi:MAG TPA: PEP-CTERM sorting domain-containing protein [Syntrophorhabdaceae bacterium]|nr:PEP-CTERM sorting domain-containing protein [Syntrophorhabdaceae bacterium]